MNLQMNLELVKNYTSKSQIARVLTEDWVIQNIFCPNCNKQKLFSCENNRQVADFYCQNCKEEYELKSKNGMPASSIPDGAYETMIKRLNSKTNPNLLFLDYNAQKEVNNFFIIPKYYFISEIITKRKPLAFTARRAGWIGCNIEYSKIPKSGIIYLIKDKEIQLMKSTTSKWQKTNFVKDLTIENRGWTLDILNIIENLNTTHFTLNQIYNFENELKEKHPRNNNIQAKIRQQLQILRDRNFLKFASRGNYNLT
jgi:type II restriction enzyme